MKRILLTILALIYFAISVQAATCLHDCITLFTNCLGEQSEDENNIPCKSDPTQCKLETTHTFAHSAAKSFRVVGPTSPGIVSDNWLENGFGIRRLVVLIHSFAISLGIPLFILHQVFRI